LHGTSAQAELLAETCARIEAPVVAVMGNHDERHDGSGEVAQALRDAGITVLQGEAVELEVDGLRVGLAGVTGAFGGFGETKLKGLSERQRRALYRRAARQATALDDGLRAIAGCDVRVALLHYSPTTDTLHGEPRELWGYLGSELLAEPIRQHPPDVVVHAHAHCGCFRGRIGQVPVYNVSAEVLNGRVCLLEVPARDRVERG
jgi:Icc-related predicted phosphoesterase